MANLTVKYIGVVIRLPQEPSNRFTQAIMKTVETDLCFLQSSQTSCREAECVFAILLGPSRKIGRQLPGTCFSPLVNVILSYAWGQTPAEYRRKRCLSSAS